MKRILLSFFILAAGYNFSSAQGFEFRVMANKGDNQIKKSGSDSWDQVKTGNSVFSGSEVKLGENAYLGLMHKTGKTMEIKTPGVHNVDELSKKILTGGSSVATKYGEYLLAKMNDVDSDDINAESLNNMRVTGAVSRATDDAPMEVMLPKTSIVLNLQDAVVRWIPKEGVSTYNIEVVNLFEETVANQEVENPYFDFSTLDIDIAEQGGLLFKVVTNDDPEFYSDMYALNMYGESNREDLIKELELFNEKIPVEEDQMKNFLYAMFYEDKGLLFHALSCYNKLVIAEPENGFYQAAYAEFLKRSEF